ncbi:MAG: 54S ribosomal protein L13, partial [Paramarteilia canceri]
DIGNHVVVFNSRFIALHSDDWRRKLFRYFTGYARGKRKDVAWLMHYTRPQYIVRRAVSDRIPSGYSKKILAMRRLHVYEDHLIPEEIKGNLSGQIRQILPVPKKITEYCKEEVNRNGYQITQRHNPVGRNGLYTFFYKDKNLKYHSSIAKIIQVHLENDTSRNVEDHQMQFMDPSRHFSPIIEIVTEPCFANYEQILGFLESIKETFEINGIFDPKTQSFRCDINISSGENLGQSSLAIHEIKNVEGFKNIRLSIDKYCENILNNSLSKNQSQTYKLSADMKNIELIRSKFTPSLYSFQPDSNIKPIIITKAEINSLMKTAKTNKIDQKVEFLVNNIKNCDLETSLEIIKSECDELIISYLKQTNLQFSKAKLSKCIRLISMHIGQKLRSNSGRLVEITDRVYSLYDSGMIAAGNTPMVVEYLLEKKIGLGDKFLIKWLETKGILLDDSVGNAKIYLENILITNKYLKKIFLQKRYNKLLKLLFILEKNNNDFNFSTSTLQNACRDICESEIK